MGLDMYLEGEKYILRNWQHPEKEVKLDGFVLRRQVVLLGYWRKVPDLHGYIVEEFQGGVDECQRTELMMADLQKTLAAVEANKLPHTEGFFFGEQDASDREPTIAILKAAIAWLATPEEGVSRGVYYRASW